MMSELRQEMAEQKELETKAKASETIITLLNNAITYMKCEANMSDAVRPLLRLNEHFLAYNQVLFDMLDAIDSEDFDAIAED